MKGVAIAKDPVTPCQRGCCWSPFACATGRKCGCHAADPELPKNEPPVTRITYTDHVPGTAINNIMRATAPKHLPARRPRTRGRRR